MPERVACDLDSTCIERLWNIVAYGSDEPMAIPMRCWCGGFTADNVCQLGNPDASGPQPLDSGVRSGARAVRQVTPCKDQLLTQQPRGR